MKTTMIIAILLGASIVLSIISTAVYMTIYRYRLNRRMSEKGTKSSHSMIDPMRFFLIAFLVSCFLTFLFLTIVKIDVSVSEDLLFEKCDQIILSEQEAFGEIKGYELHEASAGDTDLCYYVKTADDKAFPDVLICVRKGEPYTYSYSVVSGGHKIEGDGKEDLPGSVHWYALESEDKGSLSLMIDNREFKIEY